MIDIDLSNISNIPVIIISSPRTGSTILGDYIADKTCRRFFNEPGQGITTLHKFLLHDSLHKNYILKEHATVYLKRYSQEFMEQPSYTIRIRRRNIIDQTLSNYIAVNRKKFLFEKGQQFSDTIKLDDSYLEENLEYIKKFNRETDSFKYKIDLDLFYEDLDLNVYESDLIPTPKPINNDELTEWAYALLKDKV